MNKVLSLLKKELMLAVSLLAAAVALVITPPTKRLLADIDWRTLGTLLIRGMGPPTRDAFLDKVPSKMIS